MNSQGRLNSKYIHLTKFRKGFLDCGGRQIPQDRPYTCEGNPQGLNCIVQTFRISSMCTFMYSCLTISFIKYIHGYRNRSYIKILL